jgi:hypothetical protein
MPARYNLRFSFGLHADQNQVRDELLQLCRTAAVDEITLMIFAETYSNGHETLDEIRSWLDLIRPWKEALETQGVPVSLNPWATVLHCDRGRTLKPSQPWQTMVDWQGNAASAVVCPLDPGWRAYYREVLSLYAAEGFRVIWLEDDIRLANHAPLNWGGCFCPLHVADFNRRAGTAATREEIVQAMMQPGPPHPWRAIWLDMWDGTQTEMVRQFRETVEPSGAQLGLMSSGPMMHAMEGRRWQEWWSALSRDRPPIHRPHFTGYADAQGDALPLAVHMMDMNRTIHPDETEIIPEIESFPHGWAKSFRQTAAHMVLSQVFGADALHLSVYDYLGNPPSEQGPTTRFLREWRPALDWLSELFPPTLRSQGIGCPWSEDQTRRKHAPSDARTWMEALFCPTHGWPLWLGGFGHAFQMRIGADVNALAGDMAWAFDDERVDDMLQRGLLLDGHAAMVLEERGFGDQIGLANIRFITQADVVYSMEELTDPNFTSLVGALVNVDDRPCTQRLAQGVLLPGAQAVSLLRGPRFERVGHGVVVYENERGGRVAVCPWDVNAPERYGGQRNQFRAAQLDALMRYLGRGKSLGHVSGGPWLVSQFFTDGQRWRGKVPRRWRGVVWNASPDAVTEITVFPPDGMASVRDAVHLDAKGNRETCDIDERTLILRCPLQQWECVVLRDDN